MPYYLNIIFEPGVGPTQYETAKPNKMIYIRSKDGRRFLVEFESAFAGRFNQNSSTPTMPGQPTTFESSNPGGKSYEEVKLKLRVGPHPVGGYKYTVKMEDGGTWYEWDPRIVPN